MPATKTRKLRYKLVLDLPPLDKEELEGLRNSIAIEGVLVPIVIVEVANTKWILDGWYRWKIATEFGYDCPEEVIQVDEEERRSLRLCLNLARRQLRQQDKRQIIADQLEETPEKSNKQIAKLLGCSHHTVKSVRTELETGGQIATLDFVEGADGKWYPANGGQPSYGFRGAAHYSTDPRPRNVVTPLGVCRFLLDIISQKYKIRTILDPCSGSGNLSKFWKKRKVISFEASRGRDFFDQTEPIKCDLVLCNPPWNGENAKNRGFIPEEFIFQILELVGSKTPIVLFCPMGMRLNQRKTSSRWKWMRNECPEISSIISLPLDVFEGVHFHSEILLFNMPRLKSHYFLGEEYL